jgi:hypothetical protein
MMKVINYHDNENDCGFAFGSWGMDRESITQKDAYLCCQVLLYQNATGRVRRRKKSSRYKSAHLHTCHVQYSRHEAFQRLC